MSTLALLALAFGLAMDATAVSIASALAAPRVRVRDALLLPFLFGAFQALMPLIGWAVGSRFAEAISAWDHWVAFVLLAGIGGKMLWEALPQRTEALGKAEAAVGERTPRNPFELRTLVVMAVATSIDALAAGITLPLLELPLWAAVATIGAVTFVLCLGGVSLGRTLGGGVGRRLDMVGGLVLVGLGLKTLLEHLSQQG